MSLPTICNNCGLKFMGTAINMTGCIGATITNSGESCPRCDAMAHYIDGKYDFVGNTITAFRGASKQDLIKFKSILGAVQAGEMNVTQAKLEAKTLSDPIKNIIYGIERHPATTAAMVAVFLGILATFLTYYMWSQDVASTEASDLEQAEVYRQQLAVSERQVAALERIAEEIRENVEISRTIDKIEPKITSEPEPEPSLIQRPTLGAMNRQERRKTKALEKKKK